MALGEKLQFGSVILAVTAALLGALSAVLGYFGSQYSDKSYLEAFRALKSEIAAARTRKLPEWTPFVQVQSNGFPALDKPMTVRLQFDLSSNDNTLPLMVRVAADKEGHYSNTITGPAGVVEQLIIEPQTYYVSVSHPSIKWKAEVLGYMDRRGKDD